jgi:hypothetical protein
MELLSTSGYMCEGTNWFAGCLDGSPGEAFNPVCEEELNVSEAENNTLVLYPNPVSKVLHATLLESAKIEILTLNGIKVLEKEVAAGKMHLDVQTLPNGFYLILINGKAHRFVKN